MKCDELKEYYYYEDRVVTPATHMYRVYHADKVDAAIAELKAENARLKKCEIWMKQHFYCEEVIACESAKNRQLKRALWLARANMARGLAEMCETQIDCCGVSRSRLLVGWDKKSKPKRMTTTEWGELWRKVEKKCRAKAEEYK